MCKEGLNFLYESYVGVFCGIASPRGFEDLINKMSGELETGRDLLIIINTQAMNWTKCFSRLRIRGRCNDNN